jgi:hypothetical protein
MPVGEIDFNAAFEGVPGMDAIMTPNGMPEDQQYHFEQNAFDLMPDAERLQQGRPLPATQPSRGSDRREL